MKFLLTAFLGFVLTGTAAVKYQVDYTPEDIAVFEDYKEKFADKRDLPMNELVVETGKYFLGTPYVNFTLEKEPEQLIINLRQLDCVTFVETTVALAYTLKSDDDSFENFCNNVRNLRFRQGELVDFTSRLHYFSDWIGDNQEMGLVRDLTGELGGDPYPIRVSLMSRYSKNYRQLVANPDLIPVIADIEQNIINKRKMYAIPAEKTNQLGEGLKDGMIVGTTTPNSMDIAHVGFLVHVNGVPHFLHASSTEKKVVITKVSFKEYLDGKKLMNGFMVAEPLAPASNLVQKTGANDPQSDSLN